MMRREWTVSGFAIAALPWIAGAQDATISWDPIQKPAISMNGFLLVLAVVAGLSVVYGVVRYFMRRNVRLGEGTDGPVSLDLTDPRA